MKGIENLDNSVCLMAMAAAMVFTTSAEAKTAVLIDIPAQPLSSALEVFGRQAGVAIIFDRAALAGKSSPALRGAYAPDAALRHLVEGSGATVQQPKSGTFVVMMPPSRSPQGHGTRTIAARAPITSASAAQAGLAPQGSPGPAGAGEAGAGPSAKPEDSEAFKEIIVTAERREANLQNTSVSVSVRSGEELAKQGRYSLQDILQDVPGVGGGLIQDTVGGMADNAGGGITIRGISSNQLARGSIVSTAPATAVYVDNVYEGAGGGYDIGGIEVLRGPQGTLYGRSATAGVVSIHTNNPELGDLGADASFETGNYSLLHTSGAVNIPLGDKAALRVAGNYYERDGYVSAKGGAQTDGAARVKLLIKPSDTFSVLLGAQFDNATFNTGGIQVKVDKQGNSYEEEVPFGSGKTKTRQYWGEFNLELGAVNLTWLPSFRTFTQDALLITPGPLEGGLSQPDYTPRDHFHTEELRLSSAKGSKIAWQTGVFFYDNRVNAQTSLKYNINDAPVFEAKNQRHTLNLGVFGEFTYPLSDALRFTGGLRYDYTYVRNDESYRTNTNGAIFPENPPVWAPLEISGDEATRKFNNISYKARLEADLTPNNLLYGVISTGVLPGDVQIATGPEGNPIPMEFKAETVTSFEVGTKNQFMGRALQLNASAFYYDFSGYQTNRVNVSGNDNVQRFQNFSVPARMYGGEMEVTFRPSRKDRFQLDYSYVNARYVDAPAEFLKYAVAGEFDQVVPHTINFGYTRLVDLPGGSRLSFHGDARYRSAHSESAQFLTPSQAERGGADYVRIRGEMVGDIEVTWTSSDDRMSITGYVRNVTNNQYKTNVLVQSIDETTLEPNVSYTPYNPRTIGIVLSASL